MTPAIIAAPEYSVAPARYSRGNMAVRTPSADGLKTRAARLIGDHLRGRWSSRERAYIVSASKVRKFIALYGAGADACTVTGELRQR